MGKEVQNVARSGDALIWLFYRSAVYLPATTATTTSASTFATFRFVLSNIDTQFTCAEILTKSGVQGKIKPVSEYGRVICRIVLSDSGTADANTISTDEEYVWAEWVATVRGSVQPSA